MSRACLVFAVVAGLFAQADGALAQPAPAAAPRWRPWRPIVSIGGGWVGAEALGGVPAETRAVSLGTATPPAFTLFDTESTLGGASRAEVAVAIPVSPMLAVEILGTVARPTLTTAISRDAEGAPAATARETIDEYTAGARVLYELPRWSFARRARPFLAAGGAYLRQLHQDRVLVETGQVWSAGAGVRLWLRGRGLGRTLGLTAETGWSWRTGAISFADGARGVPTASVRLFLGL